MYYFQYKEIKYMNHIINDYWLFKNLQNKYNGNNQQKHNR
jgi:hypothetical protein